MNLIEVSRLVLVNLNFASKNNIACASENQRLFFFLLFVLTHRTLYTVDDNSRVRPRKIKTFINIRRHIDSSLNNCTRYVVVVVVIKQFLLWPVIEPKVVLVDGVNCLWLFFLLGIPTCWKLFLSDTKQRCVWNNLENLLLYCPHSVSYQLLICFTFGEPDAHFHPWPIVCVGAQLLPFFSTVLFLLLFHCVDDIDLDVRVPLGNKSALLKQRMPFFSFGTKSALIRCFF